MTALVLALSGLVAAILAYLYLRTRPDPNPAQSLDERAVRLMSSSDAATAGELPHLVSGPRAPGWWGMLFLIVIESTVFASLILTYFYLRSTVETWPLGGFEPPELLLPTVNTGVLLLSTVPMYWADRSIRRGKLRDVKIGMLLGMVLLVVFLVLKVVEYSDKEYTWYTNAYGSIVWTIIGFHSAHVLGVILKAAPIWLLALRGYFTEERHVAIQTNGLYWYFVAAIWIPLYATLYWAPRLI